MAFPMGANVPPEQLLSMLGPGALGGLGGPGGPGFAPGPGVPGMPGGPGPEAPGAGFSEFAPGSGSAVSRMGFSTLPPIQEGQFGIPVEGMMVDPRFFMQMRDHMDAITKTDPRLRDMALLENGPSFVRQGLLNTPATGPVAGLDAFLA